MVGDLETPGAVPSARELVMQGYNITAEMYGR